MRDAIDALSPSMRLFLWIYVGCFGLLVLLLSIFVRDDSLWLAPILAAGCSAVAAVAVIWAAHDIPSYYSRPAFVSVFGLIQIAVAVVLILALVWRPDLLWEPPQ